MDGPIPAELQDDIRAAFKRHLYDHGITVTTAAKQIGYASSVLSQWQDGKYGGDNDEVTRATNNWLEEDARARNLTLSSPYVPTRVCEAMRGAIRVAHARGKMCVCIMPAGTGKTMMMETMSAELRGFMIYCDARSTPNRFLAAVARATGIKQRDPDIMVDIVQRLRGSRRPLFLDEAHLLHKAVFGPIRSIYDQTGVTIVMAGTDEIVNRIDDRAGGRGQLASRCLIYNALAYYYDVDSPDRPTQGKPLYTREEIRAYLDGMRVKIDPDAFELAWAIASMPSRGCLRMLGDLVATIVQVCRKPRITRESLWEALEIYDVTERPRILENAKAFVDRMRKTA